MRFQQRIVYLKAQRTIRQVQTLLCKAHMLGQLSGILKLGDISALIQVLS